MTADNARPLIQIASYNTNLQAERGLPQDLVDWLAPTLQVSTFLSREPRAPDIVAVGFQELLPLHLGLSGLSQHVIESRNALILSQIEEHAPNKERYTLIAKVVNVGVALLVYGRDDGIGRRACDVQTQWTGCGPAYMGNKGAVGVRFRLPNEDGSIGEVYTFVCAHLTAHAYKNACRVEDYHHIVGSLLFPPLPNSDFKSPTTMFSTSHLFFFGDLNFRLSLPPTHALAAPDQLSALMQSLSTEEGRSALKDYDQLVIERDVKGTIFQCFHEGEFWRFKCSYKYKLGEVDKYDPKRMPAWTDRIMYATHTDSPDTPQDSNITDVLYTAIPSYTTSDHKPVVCVLLLPPPVHTTSVPVLQLPEGYHPTPDPWANVKKYTGRVLDRLIGYTWWLLTMFGAGSAILGIGNLFLSLGAYRWWRVRSAEQEVLLP
ncbi:skeletal muscle/kidney enriched inositol 5-phosphatase [Lentinus tigrinus ALCF2SS1-7]|uniref:Skeletal muscle/kidney enriched inositol 5-phosphatase n=1 Tax=Lentinus tigrinus ALCF2SS1-6 TaxID=1328759 RepID=A0A5C2SSN2_9APHY|nr:skeletal muscle/kidney enriched inositol 5-phosphatase [Lentinus tigrinus ALCF2SS1-6]RPD80309.1 skeletal muscle/kidney enriched inositol 5-phosphatase [Lentinus tigrinus ALCF2SS1-7]